jgi:hypothetical protein
MGTGCAGAFLRCLQGETSGGLRKEHPVNSSLIGKIEKAKRYAQERDRISFTNLSVSFRGENDTHQVSLDGERWSCSCDFFAGWGTCAHTMTLERILGEMLPREALSRHLASAS